MRPTAAAMRLVEKDLVIDDNDAKAVREARAAWSAALGRTLAAFTARSAMGDSVTSVQRVQASIETLSPAANRRSQGISRIHATEIGLDGMTQQNAALAPQSAAAAERLKGQAHRLHAVVSRFQVRPA